KGEYDLPMRGSAGVALFVVVASCACRSSEVRPQATAHSAGDGRTSAPADLAAEDAAPREVRGGVSNSGDSGVMDASPMSRTDSPEIAPADRAELEKIQALIAALPARALTEAAVCALVDAPTFRAPKNVVAFNEDDTLRLARDSGISGPLLVP